MNIASVRVRGAPRTRESFLGSLINPVLENTTDSGDVSTLASVLRTTTDLKGLLEETDLFHSVDASLERSKGPLTNPNDVDVVLLAREKGRYFLNTSTQVGNNEGGAVRAFLSSVRAIAHVTFGRARLAAFATLLVAPRHSKRISRSRRRLECHSRLRFPLHSRTH